MRTPDISYIVSAWQKPLNLAGVLNSLQRQTHTCFEAIVTDNSTDETAALEQCHLVESLRDPRFRYVRTVSTIGPEGVVKKGKIKISDCYWSAEWGAREAKGQWLCFACDDSYYMQPFGKTMLRGAYDNGWDLVLCDLVMASDILCGTGCHVFHPSFAVKDAFIVRRSIFPGFSGKARRSAAACADRALSEQLIKAGVSWGVVPEVLMVHN